MLLFTKLKSNKNQRTDLDKCRKKVQILSLYALTPQEPIKSLYLVDKYIITRILYATKTVRSNTFTPLTSVSNCRKENK